jgi:L-fucose isomerase-like protein
MNRRIGFVSVGHPDYIDDLVLGQTKKAIDGITRAGYCPVVFGGGPVADHRAAMAAGKYLAAGDVSGVVLFLASWVECPTVMSALREVEHLPLCLWGFPMCEQNGKLESTGSYVSFAMIKGVLDRAGYRYIPVLGDVEDGKTKQKIACFCRAASAAAKLKRSRVGLVGYTSMSIYTGTFDHLFMRLKVGPEIEQIDSYTLLNTAESKTAEEKQKVIEYYKEAANIHGEVGGDALLRSAGIYLASEELIKDRALDALNIKCQYEFSKEYKMVPCVPLSLLADLGFVTSCEGDILNTVSMLILNLLTGQTVTYGDCMNHSGNTVKFSSCGFLPFSMGEPGGALIRNFMPHPGFSGIQCSFALRPEKVTLIRLVEDRCSYHILYFTGMGEKTELRGGYMPALDVKLNGDVSELVKNYSGQHYAICYGDASEQIEMLSEIMGIRAIKI